MDLRSSGFFVLIPLLSLAISACAKESPPPSDTNFIPAASLMEAQRIAQSGVVHCEDASRCSPATGMITGARAEGVYQCTAFLISPDLVGTNSHCVPDDLRNAGADCSNR